MTIALKGSPNTIILRLTDGQNSVDLKIALITGNNVTHDTTLTFTGAEVGTLSDGTSTASFSEIERFALGSGNDTVFGGAGNDVVSAGGGDDSLIGAAGNDLLDGGSGNDLLFGGDGADTLIAGIGNDSIFGGSVGDVVDGGFHLEESADGQTMDAVWTGQPSDCGRTIRGQRRAAEGRPDAGPALQFLLQRAPAGH